MWHTNTNALPAQDKSRLHLRSTSINTLTTLSQEQISKDSIPVAQSVKNGALHKTIGI